MIIARSPLRVSFFGGGTDYPEHFLKDGGAVLATAIDKYLYVTASPFLSRLFDYSIRLSYRNVELVRRHHEIEHRVFRECLKLCDLEKDIELQTMADLPAFTGLGSSSSFTVALLHALHSFKGEFLTPHEVACEAIHVERHLLHENVGCQDQVIAAFGGFNLVEFRSERDFEVQRIPVTPDCLGRLERHLLLVFTGIKRKASDVAAGQLAKRSRNAGTLREMREMVYRGFDILTSGRRLHNFGELLHHAWLAKHSLDGGISNPEIDELYERGRKAGAIGGKLLGAGGGGFMLFFVPPAARPKLQKAFRNWQTLDVRLNAPGSQIIFS
ncbi:MAG: GHMP kinase [Verrucomicrobiota bacterium]|jgi:D-glycero-alpha-D-manno-heptose-7-phosphate kinase